MTRILTWFHTVRWWWHSWLWYWDPPDSIQYGDGGTTGYDEDTDLIPYSMVMVAQPAMVRPTWFHTVRWWWHSWLWWDPPDSIQYGDGGTTGYDEDTDLIPYSTVMVAQLAMVRPTWFHTVRWWWHNWLWWDPPDSIQYGDGGTAGYGETHLIPYSMVMVAQLAMVRPTWFHTVRWWWHSWLWWDPPDSIQYGDGGTTGYDEDTDLIPYNMVMVAQLAMMRILTWFHTVWWWWHSRLWWDPPDSIQYGDGGTTGYDEDTDLIPYSMVMVAQPAMMRTLRIHAMYRHQTGRNTRLGLFDLALSSASVSKPRREHILQGLGNYWELLERYLYKSIGLIVKTCSHVTKFNLLPIFRAIVFWNRVCEYTLLICAHLSG